MPTSAAGVDLYQEDACLTTDGGMEILGDQDLVMEESPNRLPYQIFPDPMEVVLEPEGYPTSPTSMTSLSWLDHEKERLPSIVVEPTDVSEVESGELRWPVEDVDFEEDEEDLFLEQCIPPANIADWGEDEEEETPVIVNNQENSSLLDLESDAFTDDTPTLPPETTSALN